MQELVPDIESGIPLPSKSSKNTPSLTPSQELSARTHTIKWLSDVSGIPLIPNNEEQAQAEELAMQMTADPNYQPDYARYPNETMAYLAGMVAQSNCMLVEELSDLKMYVVNKLISEIETSVDPKVRISAIAKLGEVDGVDAFKKRSETTITLKPIEEVEKELFDVLDSIDATFTMDELTYEEISNDADDDVGSSDDDELYEGDFADEPSAGSIGVDEPAIEG